MQVNQTACLSFHSKISRPLMYMQRVGLKYVSVTENAWIKRVVRSNGNQAILTWQERHVFANIQIHTPKIGNCWCAVDQHVLTLGGRVGLGQRKLCYAVELEEKSARLDLKFHRRHIPSQYIHHQTLLKKFSTNGDIKELDIRVIVNVHAVLRSGWEVDCTANSMNLWGYWKEQCNLYDYKKCKAIGLAQLWCGSFIFTIFYRSKSVVMMSTVTS